MALGTLEFLMQVFKFISDLVSLKSTINIGYCLTDDPITLERHLK